MTRPPTARPPPSPAGVKPSEVRRKQRQLYGHDGGNSPKGMFHPVTTAPQVGPDGRNISASFSSSVVDDPDNSSILRGAWILRQQFMERSRTGTAHPGKRDRETVAPVPERLFPCKNDEAFNDLVGIRTIKSPGSPNDVTLSIDDQDWSDPWSPRGSAFDPASRGVRDQRHEAMFGNVTDDVEIQQSGFQRTTPFNPPKSRPERPVNKDSPTKRNQNWQSVPSPLLVQVEEDQGSASIATPGQETSFTIGPIPLDNETKRKQDTAKDTIILEKAAADFKQTMAPKKLPGQHHSEWARMSDELAFDNFIAATSLDDHPPAQMIVSKDGKRAASHKHRHGGVYGGYSKQLPTNLQIPSSLTKKKNVILPRPVGRLPVRSYSSSGIARDKPKHRRSHSAGVSQRRYQNPRIQSSIRDDFLCGMESNVKTACTPEQQKLLQSEIIEDLYACAPLVAISTKKEKKIGDASNMGKKKRHYSTQLATFSTSLVVLCEEDRFEVLSPESNEYMRLRKSDSAFQHAINGGGLWQALVGGHVRFPKNWWQGSFRTAPLGCQQKLAGRNRWVYYDRHRIKGNKFLNQYVKKRDEPGRILLHLVVRDFMTSTPILDLAIGCFHPNAKSIRSTEQPNKQVEDCRDVWIATRFRTDDIISVVDPSFLSEKMGPSRKSPLGDSRRRISNGNVRAIFGETPPVRTAFVLESDIYEDLAPVYDFYSPDVLLKKYVFHS